MLAVENNVQDCAGSQIGIIAVAAFLHQWKQAAKYDKVQVSDKPNHHLLENSI